jgi:hypothetical protein
VNPELVRRAAAEYFTEGFLYAEIHRIVENTDPEQRLEARESLQPTRSVPDGCFVWINHLVWLERILEITTLPLAAVEAEGLLLLKRERDRFQASHPPCHQCGMPNEPHALRCRECMAEIGK